MGSAVRRMLNLVAAITGSLFPVFAANAQTDQAWPLISAGAYVAFFSPSSSKGKVPQSKPIVVKAFAMARNQVTNTDFLRFVDQHPEWRKTEVKAIFAERSYLQQWPSDLSFGAVGLVQNPVTNVSYFAAEAYCEAIDARLPSTDEWEYALADAGRNQKSVAQTALNWLAEPNHASLADVGTATPNFYGVSGLVGLIWEWTSDFDSFVTSTELRATDGKDSAQFCGNGGTGVKDTADYPAFMRFSMRASLKANYTLSNLGFRCVRDL